MGEHSVGVALLIAASLARDVERSVRDWRGNAGVQICRPEPVTLLPAQKRHASAEQCRELEAGAEVLRSLERIESTYTEEVHIADSPQSVQPAGLMLRIPVDQRGARVVENAQIADRLGHCIGVFILERERSAHQGKFPERGSDTNHASNVAV